MSITKYSFREFVAAYNGKDFDDLNNANFKFADYILNTIENDKKHDGDCTNQSSPCELCMLETLLKEYHEYYFNEEKWREENGI